MPQHATTTLNCKQGHQTPSQIFWSSLAAGAVCSVTVFSSKGQGPKPPKFFSEATTSSKGSQKVCCCCHDHNQYQAQHQSLLPHDPSWRIPESDHPKTTQNIPKPLSGCTTPTVTNLSGRGPENSSVQCAYVVLSHGLQNSSCLRKSSITQPWRLSFKSLTTSGFKGDSNRSKPFNRSLKHTRKKYLTF